ncbi:MAG TPA: hypothetical protein VF794_27275 [Archangium sp.]|jgi:hypothetical protein|uniref:hypothetical protein n=1 Tax=Archangium sp. TaxID=1872627 RepID=UPI002EDB622A
MKKPATRAQLRRRHPRGQAMVEYSVINWVLVLALVVTMTSNVFGNQNVIDLFLQAYQVYYDSFYLVLNLPFP